MKRTLLSIASVTLMLGCSEPEAPSHQKGPYVPTPTQAPREELAPPTQRPEVLPDYDPETSHQTQPVGEEDLQLVGDLAIVSDPTTRSIYIANTETGTLVHTIETPGRPGRIAIAGRQAHVVLQGLGAVTTIDLDTGLTRNTAPACPAPRGIAADQDRGRLWVACASGELVGLELSTLEKTSMWRVDADLRDVVALETGLYVSRFRAAEILHLDAETGLELSPRVTPRHFRLRERVNTMWRMTQGTNPNTLIMSYQTSVIRPLTVRAERPEKPDDGSYIIPGECGSSPVSILAGTANVAPDGSLSRPIGRCQSGAVPVDVDQGPCGPISLAAAPPLTGFDGPRHHGPCQVLLPAQATRLSQAYHPARDRIALVTRADTLALHLQENQDSRRLRTITLREDTQEHLGHRLFHADVGVGLACASCHPSGADDGHVWKFDVRDRLSARALKRRTQNLRGGIEGRLHWDGEFEDITELTTDVFTSRMGGFVTMSGDARAMRDWLNGLEPEPGRTPGAEQAQAVAHGAQVFADAGCADCHHGDTFTDYEFHDVGTGGTFKTPTLRGISGRHQLMHDGCAQTLRARFDPECGGDQHGDLEGLTETDLDDLTVYLETL